MYVNVTLENGSGKIHAKGTALFIRPMAFPAAAVPPAALVSSTL